MKSQCKSGDCGATNPGVGTLNLSHLPDEIQVKLRERGFDIAHIRKCSYCKSIWAELDGRIIQIGRGDMDLPNMTWFL